MDKTTTKKLEEMLLNIEDEKALEKYLNQVPAKHPLIEFADYFQSYLAQRHLEKSEICAASGIERSYFYHILITTIILFGFLLPSKS